MKPKKYDYLLVLQGHYGHGWEDLTAEDTAVPGAWKRISANREDYRKNECGRYRIINRRELANVE